MESQLSEAGTFPAQVYAESFFAKLPTDARFLQCTYQKFMPSSSIDGKTIEFNLDRYDAANVYLIQDTNLEVTVSIVKNDGTLPAKEANVSVVNNFLHSMFESVRLTINDMPISVSPNNYPYKAYIANCLTYSSFVKSAQLSCQGWYSDTATHMGAGAANIGWVERSNLFRDNYDENKNFKYNGTTLFGRLLHDLVACETGLPPNTKVKFELDRSDDTFVLLSENDETEKYRLKLLNIALFVPVAQLSAQVFQEINSIMTRKNEPKAIGIHYRRIEVRPISLPRNKEEYNSDGLFTDSDLPCKIVICFVKTGSKVGDYHTNPFDFGRKWEIPKASSELNIQSMSEREKFLENRIKQIEEQFQKFQASFAATTQKGKGRGKKSNKSTSSGLNEQELSEEISKEAEKRLRSFLQAGFIINMH